MTPPLQPQARFDPDGSGTVSFDKLGATGGLLEFIRTSFGMTVGGDQNPTDTSNSPMTPPDIRTDRLRWFRFYNESGDGYLNKVPHARIPHSVFQTVRRFWCDCEHLPT